MASTHNAAFQALWVKGWADYRIDRTYRDRLVYRLNEHGRAAAAELPPTPGGTGR